MLKIKLDCHIVECRFRDYDPTKHRCQIHSTSVVGSRLSGNDVVDVVDV